MTYKEELEKKKYLKKMLKKAMSLYKKYSAETWDEVFEMSLAWNRNHDENNQICVVEHWNDETDEINGFSIEDEIFIF